MSTTHNMAWFRRMMEGNTPENARIIQLCGDSQWGTSTGDLFPALVREWQTKYGFKAWPLPGSVNGLTLGLLINNNIGTNVTLSARLATDDYTYAAASNTPLQGNENRIGVTALADGDTITKMEVRPRTTSWIGDLGVAVSTDKVRCRFVYENNTSAIPSFKWAIDTTSNTGSDTTVTPDNATRFAAIEARNEVDFPGAVSTSKFFMHIKANGSTSNASYIHWGGLVGPDNGGEFDDSGPWMMGAANATGGTDTNHWDGNEAMPVGAGQTVDGNTADWSDLDGFIAAVAPTVGGNVLYPNVVLIGLGHNDADATARGAVAFRQNLESIIASIDAEFIEAGAPLPNYLIPHLWDTDNIPEARWRDYWYELGQLCGTNQGRQIGSWSFAESYGYSTPTEATDGTHITTAADADRFMGDVEPFGAISMVNAAPGHGARSRRSRTREIVR